MNPAEDYISRESIIREQKRFCGYLDDDMLNRLEIATRRIPAADVVARDCFNRILAENDTMREQLAKIGKKPGDNMDDVGRVVHSFWDYNPGDNIPYCYNCGMPQDTPCDFCPSCGAIMDGGEA